MAPPEAKARQWTAQVAREHRELRKTVAGLRRFVEQPRPGLGEDGQHTWAAELAGRLVALHDKLFRHFRHEEQGGMVEDLQRHHPEASRKIEILVDEHPRMLRQLREIVTATLKYSEGQTPSDQRLRQRLIAFLDRMERHDRGETELIQGLAYHDLGAGD